MKSISFERRPGAGHTHVHHSPNGVDKIAEYTECCMAWLIQGITGEIIRLEHSSYERQLLDQKFSFPIK